MPDVDNFFRMERFTVLKAFEKSRNTTLVNSPLSIDPNTLSVNWASAIHVLDFDLNLNCLSDNKLLSLRYEYS